MVTAAEGEAPEPVGPFPDMRWVKKYLERIKKHGYFKTEIQRLVSPRLIGVKDKEFEVVFDPDEGIDK